MEEEKSDVCAQLDKLTLQILKITQEQVKYRVKLEESMKQGFFNIAKARYIMGNKSVSSLQLPTEDSPEFDALCTVNCTEKKGFVNHTVFKICENESSTEHNSVDNKIRKRNVSEDRVVELLPQKHTNKIIGTTNPIKWFGLLVPKNLQNAQHDFQSVLSLVVECANIQTELDGLLKKYKELLAIKDQ